MKGIIYGDRGIVDRIFRGRSRWCKWLTITAIVLIILVVIIVPVAVVLTDRNSLVQGLKATVLVPLYIYPTSNTTYDPLHKAYVFQLLSPNSQLTTPDSIQEHPNLNFTVIINPNSGPGDSALPDDSYTPEIAKLNSFPNVRTVGYVRTGYGTRNISDVLADVATYSGWASGVNISMHGIFFDEAPYDYNEGNATFLTTINQAVKNSTGIQPDRLVSDFMPIFCNLPYK